MKVETKLRSNEVVNTPSGAMADQITSQDLIKNPEKYIHLYKDLYVDGDKIAGQLAVRVGEASSRVGKNSILRKSKGPEGVTYNIVTKRPAKKKAKK